MNFHINRCCLTMLLTLGAANVACAETVAATSLEWLTCSAEAIVLGNITEIATSQGPHAVTYEDCVVDVQRVLKGDLDGKQVAFTLLRLGGSPTAQPLLKSKAGVLLFLSKSKDHGSERHLDGKWVPTTRHGNPSVIDLSQPPEKVYSKDMKLVGDQEEMLKIVGRWAKSPVKHSLYSDVPYDSPIFHELWAGSAVYLIVPAEEKYREQFMKLARSAKPHERAKAAYELSKFPGEETEAVLRELLEDDTERYAYYAQDQISHVQYYVRSAAYTSLEALGKAVPELALQRRPTPEEQRKLRVQTWTASFGEALKEGWKISVADGPARLFEQREHTIVNVTCSREKQEAKFTLVPKQWPADDLPETEYLGTNGINSQGARRFYLHGELPDEVKQQVVSYFGLEKTTARGGPRAEVKVSKS